MSLEGGNTRNRVKEKILDVSIDSNKEINLEGSMERDEEMNLE
jgi:hypothetical protein